MDITANPTELVRMINKNIRILKKYADGANKQGLYGPVGWTAIGNLQQIAIFTEERIAAQNEENENIMWEYDLYTK